MAGHVSKRPWGYWARGPKQIEQARTAVRHTISVGRFDLKLEVALANFKFPSRLSPHGSILVEGERLKLVHLVVLEALTGSWLPVTVFPFLEKLNLHGPPPTTDCAGGRALMHSGHG